MSREIAGTLKGKINDPEKDNILSGFKKRSITLSKNKRATLVYSDQKSNEAVLYIHGFADCVHNPEEAQSYIKNGYSFYGLDLREHGRSITSEEEKFYIERIEEYFNEIDIAIYEILRRHNKIILKGFSMGGLISSLYMKRGFYRDHISALILISPLFKFSDNTLRDYILRPIAMGIAKVFPFIKYNVNTDKYKDYITRLNIDNEDLVIHKNIPLYMGWFRAMIDGIKELEEGLGIVKPVLVLSSDKSESNLKKYKQDSDILLNVEDIKNRSKLLGRDVTYIPIKDGIHDLFLSRRDVRDKVYETIFDWMKVNV